MLRTPSSNQPAADRTLVPRSPDPSTASQRPEWADSPAAVTGAVTPHRVGGRIYVAASLLAGVGGLGFIAVKGTIGGTVMDLDFAGYGVGDDGLRRPGPPVRPGPADRRAPGLGAAAVALAIGSWWWSRRSSAGGPGPRRPRPAGAARRSCSWPPRSWSSAPTLHRRDLAARGRRTLRLAQGRADGTDQRGPPRVAGRTDVGHPAADPAEADLRVLVGQAQPPTRAGVPERPRSEARHAR